MSDLPETTARGGAVEDWRRGRSAFWLIGLGPTFWLVLFFLVPLAIVWLYSFAELRGLVDMEVTGTFDNYARALDPLYLEVFGKSVVFAGITTAISLVVGFPVALAIVFATPRWRPVLLLLVILPFWTNLLIRTYALIAVLRVRGFANFTLEWFWEQSNTLLSLLGLGSYQLLGERFEPLELLYNNTAVIIGLVYVHLPFMVLPLYAALEKLDRSLIEAALDLGASQWRAFMTVVVPLSMPGIISGAILVFIPALGSFLTPDLLGGTDSQMIANVIERQFKSANDWPFGAALSFLLMYLTFAALALRAVFARNAGGL